MAAITPRSAALDGAWQSTDSDQRFRLECSKGACRWIERNKAGGELARNAKILVEDASFRLERPNDAEVLTFLGFQPSLRQQISSMSPKPSYLIVSPSNGSLNASWYGLVVVKDSQAKLKELKNPGSTPPKSYTFTKVP